jgi:hypothetical protein
MRLGKLLSVGEAAEQEVAPAEPAQAEVASGGTVGTEVGEPAAAGR